MFSYLIYKFNVRLTKKSLDNECKFLFRNIKSLREDVNNLYEKTMGERRDMLRDFVTLEKDESLKAQLEELRDYLGIQYAKKELIKKPKEMNDERQEA